ncbi:MAG: hypothetical protein QXJ27_03375 [Thermoplasmata archaeon]
MKTRIKEEKAQRKENRVGKKSIMAFYSSYKHKGRELRGYNRELQGFAENVGRFSGAKKRVFSSGHYTIGPKGGLLHTFLRHEKEFLCG